MRKKNGSEDNRISVTYERETFASSAAVVENALRGALLLEGAGKCFVEAHLVTDESMRRINRETRKKDVPTNVLSFVADRSLPHPELPKGFRYCGEIFVAPRHISKKKEDIRILAVHGLLHLLGYEHKKKNDRMVMEAREREIFRSLFSPSRGG